MTTTKRLALALFTLILLALSLPAAANVGNSQGSSIDGTVRGTVTDSTGGVLPGAEVTVRHETTGESTTGLTDETGNYEFTGLPPGPYTLTAEAPSFRMVTYNNVELMPGQPVLQNFTLEIAVDTTLIVVGSRAQPRSVTESPVPVDVISAEEFASQGSSDLSTQLRTVVPSFNINIQPISDAATIVRPASLRNLAPDHTLVLVNGKRRHRAAVITWLGNGIADGSQGPDISVIPAIALRQVEVLRDGASAQYGSDAIAGVMNFELKDARSGGSVEFQTGAFLDASDGDTATCGGVGRSCNGIGGHGAAYTVAANVGLPLGQNGFLNLSAEYGNAGATNRAVQRNDALNIINSGNNEIRNPAQVWGSPKIEDDLKLFANFGHLFDNGLQFYGHTNYTSRKVTGGFYFRNPNTRSEVFSGDGGQTLLVGDRLWAETGVPGAGGCPTVPIVDQVADPTALQQVEDNPNCFTLQSRFQGGFTPQFGGDLFDASLVAGVRGVAVGSLTWDLSFNIGKSKVDQFIFDTVNASLGFDTPTSFNPGSYGQDDINLNFDLSYAAGDMINLASGVEWRNEKFTIGAGDMPSWEIGPYAAQGFSSGSNGFNGYREVPTAGSWSRSNLAVYGDIEVQDPDGKWLVGAAARIEDFQDFGTTMNSKLSGRYAVTDSLALRAAVSSGFRAPTPGQQNAFNVSTAFDPDLGDLVNDGTVPSISGAARLKGGEQLQPETSLNCSAGAIYDNGPFTFTADYFLVDVSDRIALSRRFVLTPDEVESLVAEGVVEARNLARFRFFINDFSTRTQGFDLVSTYTPEALGGNTTFSMVFNHTKTELTTPLSETVDDFRLTTLEKGLPETRWNLGFTHRGRRADFLARLSYFGSYWDSEDAQNHLGRTLAPTYPSYGGKALLDLEVSFPFGDNVRLAVGGQNVLNTYPDVNPYAADNVGNQYGQFSPFGFNGAYYYARINYSWGANRF